MAHSSCAASAGSGKLSTQGLKTGTRAFTYSEVSRGIGDEFNTEADLGKRHDADIEQLKRPARDEGQHLRLRLGPPEFREDVRVQ